MTTTPLDPLVRGDDRVFTYTHDASLSGATVKFRLYSEGFSISKSTSDGGITVAGAVATIAIAAADWATYPVGARQKTRHLIEIELTIAGKVSTPVLAYPIDVCSDVIV